MSSQTDSDLDERTSSTLIVRAKQRAPEAWRQVHRTYGPLVYSWCRQCKIKEQDAADILQDVFRSIYARIDSFDPRNSDSDEIPNSSGFRAWLFTITRNKIRDYLRLTKNRPTVLGGSDLHERLMQVPDNSAKEAQLQDVDVSGLAREVLAIIQTEFELTTWTAFWKSTVDGLPSHLIADELGITQGAVRQAKYRVLKRLREEMSGLEL